MDQVKTYEEIERNKNKRSTYLMRTINYSCWKILIKVIKMILIIIVIAIIIIIIVDVQRGNVLSHGVKDLL